MAYEQRKAELDAGLALYADKLETFLKIADFLYKDLGLIGEVHSAINGDEITYSLTLIDRPSTSIKLVKTIQEDGTQTEWQVYDKNNLL